MWMLFLLVVVAIMDVDAESRVKCTVDVEQMKNFLKAGGVSGLEDAPYLISIPELCISYTGAEHINIFTPIEESCDLCMCILQRTAIILLRIWMW